MTEDYIDNTLEVIIKTFEQKNMQNTEKYEKLKKLQEKRKDGNNI